MKVRIFNSQKPFNLMEDINEFLAEKPKIAQVLQSQGGETVTISIFYQETQPTQAAPADPMEAPPGIER